MSEPSRVLVISNMYPSKKYKTFGIFVKNQVESLKNQGMKIDICAINDQRMGKIFVMKKYLVWMLRIFFRLIFKGNKYDIVHAHYVFPSGVFALFFKKIFGAKLIVTSHGGDIDKMAKKNKFFFWQTQKILDNADHIIAVGNKLKQDIVDTFSTPNGKISVVNMGVNRGIFKPQDKKKARLKVKISKENFHILFVGNMIKAKGIEELIDAYKELKNTHPFLELHLIGADKEPNFLSEIKNKIQKNQIKDVNFYPAMDQKEIALWMAAVDVFVLPSHMEGFGLVALEAMSCRTPVVGSDVGGLAYLLKDNAGIKIEPKNSSSLKKGLEIIILNEPKRSELIRNGEILSETNKEEIQISKLLAIYNETGETV